MSRVKFKDEVFLEIAATLSQLSTCDRSTVGAVIVRRGRCVSWGFNGAPPGMPHCEENDHGWMQATGASWSILQEQFPDAIDPVLEAVKTYGCRNATHAEANALAFAARQGISTENGTLYITVSPCDTCAKLLIAAGITRVVFGVLYRDPRGVELLEQGGIQIG